MEMVYGLTVRMLLEHHGGRGIPVPLAMSLVHQAASGLVAVHAHKVVHRDLKPENLLLELEVERVTGACRWHLKLYDFGLAVAIVWAGSPDSHRRPATAWSPEQRTVLQNALRAVANSKC